MCLLAANKQKNRLHFSPFAKGHNSPPSGLTSACVSRSLAKSARLYPKTHDCGAVQSNAPFRESPDTQSSLAVASPLANENINLPCVRRNPSDSLNLALSRNAQKLRGVRQPQQFVYLKSTLMRSHFLILPSAIAFRSNYSSRLMGGRHCWRSWEAMNERWLLLMPSRLVIG